MTFSYKGQWIQIEKSKKDNNIQAEDAAQCALEYFVVGVKSWWNTHQKFNGIPKDIVWEKLKKM